MKKASLFHVLLISALCSSQEKSFFFNLKHHQNSTYLSELKIFTEFKINRNADKETLKLFDSLGVNQTYNGSKKESWKVMTKTKKTTNDLNLPVYILGYDFEYNGTLNKNKIDDNFKFETIKADGFIDIDNRLTINSVLVDDSISNKQQEYKKLIENREMLISFAKLKIRLGDTIPFIYIKYYPVLQDNNNYYNIDCSAIFIKEKKGIAYFKVKSNKSEKSDYTMIVDGIIKYDIENNFIASTLLKSKLHFKETIENLITTDHEYSDNVEIRTKLNKNI